MYKDPPSFEKEERCALHRDMIPRLHVSYRGLLGCTPFQSQPWSNVIWPVLHIQCGRASKALLRIPIYHVGCLYESKVVGDRLYVGELDVTFKRPKERDPVAKDHGDGRDRDLVDQGLRQDSLNRAASIHVYVLHALCREAIEKRAGRSRCVADRGDQVWRQLNGVVAEHHHGCLAIGPHPKGQHLFKSLAAHDQSIDRVHERPKSQVFTFGN